MESPERYIVFTDLDGTLIDFETYSPEIATPTVKRLLEAEVPVVFCSSKTLAEQKALMEKMGINTLCIVENGSGIFLPDQWDVLPEASRTKRLEGGKLVQWGTDSGKILDTLETVSSKLGIDFKPYSELSIKEVCKITGLDEQGARNARDRDFSETLTAQLEEDQWLTVQKEFAAHGMQCLCGGRFHTVTAKGTDKGKALKQTVEALRKAQPAKWISLALGDSANDAEMLRVADYPFLVQRPNGSWYDFELPKLGKVEGIGPQGWVKAVSMCL